MMTMDRLGQVWSDCAKAESGKPWLRAAETDMIGCGDRSGWRSL